MSNWERHGTRDMSLSKWHRQMLRQRAETAAEGERAGMIDIDWLEFCSQCRTNLFLVEAARDINHVRKVATQTAKLAADANIPAYIVLYTPSGEDCTNDRRCRRVGCQHGVSAFRIRQIIPVEGGWRDETSESFADFVLEIHRMHRAVVCGSRFATERIEAELHAADPPAEVDGWPEPRKPGSGLPDSFEVA
jgi:hypothetical protein